MQDQYSTLLETARRCAGTATEIIRARDGRTDPQQKADESLVTAVDHETDRAIRETIAERHPDHEIRSEESGVDSGESFTWVVDPLDGTANFVTGFEHYCVSIAVLEAGKPVVGVVARPAHGDVYTAVADCGAWHNGTRMRVSDTGTLSEGTVLCGISPQISRDSQFLETVRRLIEPGRTRGVRRLGSGACDLSLVADGTFDCFLDTHTSPWDVAAGSLLVTEAGGQVTNLRGGPVGFTAEQGGVNVLASNGAIHAAVERLYRNAGATGCR